MDQQQHPIRVQYRDDSNLNARIALHARFSTNTYGWSNWVFDHLSFPQEACILELGCGPGSLWAANRHRLSPGLKLTLTDFSTGMVSRARESLATGEGPFNFTAADAQSVPFRDRSFDAVVANHMLYHVAYPREALHGIHRVLKPEGCLYATTVGEGHMREMWDLLVPYVPDVHRRVSEISRGFTLQNGGAQLAGIFDRVEVHEYPDHLEVTEPESLMAYLRSSPTSVLEALTPAQLEVVRTSIEERIATHGSFHIGKSSGIVIASKR
jgi:SAM-dependent methyltransferase